MKQTTFHPEDHMESVLAMHNKKASITHEAKMLKDKKISTAGLTPKEQEKKNITWIGKILNIFLFIRMNFATLMFQEKC